VLEADGVAHETVNFARHDGWICAECPKEAARQF
jgi:hypothetical protein